MSEVTIRDSRGAVRPVDEARCEIRAAFGHSTDAALAANARGEVHPSQAATVARHVRTQRLMVHVLLSAPAVLGAVIVSIVAANDPGVRANAAAWSIAAAAVIVLLAQVLASRIGRTIRVEPVRGRLTGRALGSDLVELGNDTVPVPSRWIGLPVHAYVVRSGGVRLFLSGDVVDRELTPVDESAPPPRVAEIVVHGDDNVGAARLQFALVVVSTALAVWALVSVVQQDEPSSGAAGFTLLWAATSAVMLLASSIALVSARREARAVYAVRGGADGAPVLEIDRAGQERRHAVAALRRIESEIHDDPAKRSWKLHVESGPAQQLRGRAGARIVQEIRRLRPEVPFVEYRPSGGDSAGGP